MMARLFYRTLRLLTWIIIIMVVIFALSKLLPFIGDIIKNIVGLVKVFVNKIGSLNKLLN